MWWGALTIFNRIALLKTPLALILKIFNYTHLKVVFGENPKTTLPEYNCNQALVF
jgi:hypothetical protein